MKPKTEAVAVDGNEGETLNLNLSIARQIRKALKLSGGKVDGKGGAAELLGINSGTLRHKMRKLGIPFGKKAKRHYN